MLPPLEGTGSGVAPAPDPKSRPCPYRDVRETRRGDTAAASPIRRPAATGKAAGKGAGKTEGKVAAAAAYGDRRAAKAAGKAEGSSSGKAEEPSVGKAAGKAAGAEGPTVGKAAGKAAGKTEGKVSAAAAYGDRRELEQERRVRRRQTSHDHAYSSEQWRAWYRSAASHWSVNERRWKYGAWGWFWNGDDQAGQWEWIDEPPRGDSRRSPSPQRVRPPWRQQQ